MSTSNLRVEGQVPSSLVGGQFVRNGPNPKHPPRGSYHWFDGDGMLHGTYFQSDDNVCYTNRYVRTVRFLEEKEARGAIFYKLGDIMEPEGMITVLIWNMLQRLPFVRTLKGRGTANTALTYHDGRLLALVEADLPYEISAPSLSTVGQYNFHGQFNDAFTAHPKVCPITGELIFFRYSFQEKPSCKYFVADQGKLTHELDIELDTPVMMHDFAITEHYSIVMDLPLTFRVERLLSGEPLIQFERDRCARFGIFPRHAASSPVWFVTDPMYIFHTANAWEEEDGKRIVLIACRSEAVFLFSNKGMNQHQDDDESLGLRERNARGEFVASPYLYRFVFDLETEVCSQEPLDVHPGEFPKINPHKLGLPSRYIYLSVFAEDFVDPKSAIGFTSVKKYDLLTGETSSIPFGHAASTITHGGECVFVPRTPTENEEQRLSEDDGYLITYTHTNGAATSQLKVWNAKTMDPEPVCVVHLPQRVPFGFHGHYLSASDIEQQPTY